LHKNSSGTALFPSALHGNEIAEMSAAGYEFLFVINLRAISYLLALCMCRFFMNLCDEMIMQCSVFISKMFYHLHHEH
jgi:hypothetical protein